MFYTNTTFDIAMNDAANASRLPYERGVIRHTASAGVDYFTRLKTSAYFFKLNEFDGKNRNNDNGGAWVGDAWIKRYYSEIEEGYYEAYNEYPHFPLACIAMLCDLPTISDIGIIYGGGLEGYANRAVKNRAFIADNYSE